VGSWDSDQIQALDHVFANINLGGGNFVASVNMSLGGGLFSSTCDSESQKPAIDNLRAAGVLTAIASGNNGSVSQISSPGCISSAVTVGSTTKSDVISSFSNMSLVVDLLAPGSSIQSSIPVVPSSNTTTYAFFNGTSMATPHVAGAIAAIRSGCPSASANDIENALKTTGTPITDTRGGGSQTKPRIRVDLALQNLGCGGTPPVVTQNPTNLTVTAGQQATFTAAATGTPTPTVIWQVSNDGGAVYNNIAWATSTTLSFTTIAAHNGYLFRAVFTNSVGSATTTIATLTVN
jgi:subtilisin family serine protease